MKLLVIVVLLGSFLSLSAQTKPKPEVVQINTYAAGIDRFMKVNKLRAFGDTSQEETSNWKLFRTKKALDDAEDIYEKALVWTRSGKVVGVTFTLSSPSGDWAHFVTYYFRDDGSLAKIHAEINTFYGEVSIIRDQWYDSSAKQIEATRKVLDLNTRKPKKPSGDFMDQEVVVYKRVSDLPFSKLL
jgi:hypothetical protein